MSRGRNVLRSKYLFGAIFSRYQDRIRENRRSVIRPVDVNVVSLNETVMWYVFFYQSNLSGYEIKISKISDFRPKLREMGQFFSFCRSLAYSRKNKKES
jgi:hypothetical protein